MLNTPSLQCVRILDEMQASKPLAFSLVLLVAVLLVTFSINISRRPADIEYEKVSLYPDDYLAMLSSNHIHLDREFSLPLPSINRPAAELLTSSWAVQLKKRLEELSFKSGSRQIVTTVYRGSTISHIGSLINWLVSALVKTSPPLQNIVVFWLDDRPCELLKEKMVVECFEIAIGKLIFPEKSSHHIWDSRLTLIRLLNFWGFDVVVFDMDAIVVKNLKPIFDSFSESGIIASTGEYPFSLNGTWGMTMCMGCILFRSTKQTGL